MYFPLPRDLMLDSNQAQQLAHASAFETTTFDKQDMYPACHNNICNLNPKNMYVCQASNITIS